MADALGYEQLSSVFYSKRRDGWYQVLRETGLLLWERLRDSDNRGGFVSATKEEITDSAQRVLQQNRTLALPWFDERSRWDAIAAEYYRTNRGR